MMHRNTIGKNNVYIATQGGHNFDIIRTDNRPILVRQLEQDLESLQDHYQPDVKHISEENLEKYTNIKPPSRAASSQLFLQTQSAFLNDSKTLCKDETETTDALRIALWNTTRHGVYLPDSILHDRRQLYRFCTDFCYLWTMDELREYCSAAGLLACGTKTELLRRTYLALHHAQKEFLET
ncbi:hypothetical protein GpartN1_g2993.t1 [Galdieria partita]|uniref:SAP domain-containing protein n=1 Tax=Galdieria partita TaxID=83374 RepID=A0A9C7PX76_9RHOD|nr:hypothetical protein GpartN1_g2993.t1 [Galdieria partita]